MASSSAINTAIVRRVGHFINVFIIPRNLGYVIGGALRCKFMEYADADRIP